MGRLVPIVRLSLSVVFGAAVLVGPIGVARASKCVQRPFEVLAGEADVIFAGRAIAMDAELATTFEVERIYKGQVGARVVVETHAVRYAMLQPPHRYLVLARTDEKDVAAGNLYNHTCSGSLREPWPAEVDAQLGPGEAPPQPPSQHEDTKTATPDRAQPADPPTPTEPAPTSGATPGCASCTTDAAPTRATTLLMLLLVAATRSRSRRDIRTS